MSSSSSTTTATASTTTATKKPGKSILKKPSPNPPPADLQVQAKAKAVAAHHARIIHHRRDIEDSIIDSIIALSALPTTTTTSNTAATSSSVPTSSPPEDDATTFTTGVRLFQPSDYDELIAERNAQNRCGYALCGSAPVRLAPGATYKLLNWGQKDFNIVPREEIERWCSSACARKAMYVKVQLNETAAWERAGIESIRIELYDGADELEQRVADLSLDKMRREKELAVERGGMGKKGEKNPEIQVEVAENEEVTPAEPPSLERAGKEGHLVLEGHRIKFDGEWQDATDVIVDVDAKT